MTASTLLGFLLNPSPSAAIRARHAIDAALAAPDNDVAPLLPLVYATLAGMEPESGRREAIRPFHLAALARLALQEAWLGTFAAFLSRESLPAALMKGAAFAGDLYAPDEPRLGTDIDLLLEAEPAARVAAYLTATGFAEATIPGESARRRADHFWRTFVRTEPYPLEIDVHHAPAEPALFELEAGPILARAVAHPRYACPFLRVPRAEDSLLLLAVQGVRDLGFTPLNLLDAARLQRRVTPTAMEAHARRHGLHVAWASLRRALAHASSQADPIDRLTSARLALAAPCMTPRGVERTTRQHLRYLAMKTLSQYLLLDSPRRVMRFQGKEWRRRLLDGLGI